MDDNKPLKLNPTLEQRLILINQYKILEKLYPEDAETYARYQEILEDGYTLHYNDLIEYMAKPMPEEEMEFVLDILDLYSTMHLAVYRSANEKYKGKTIYFPGFDGNNEFEYLKYTRFFIFRLDRFQELKKDDSFESYNTHSPTLETYKAMLAYWRDSSEKNKFILSDEQLDNLIHISVYGTLGDLK